MVTRWRRKTIKKESLIGNEMEEEDNKEGEFTMTIMITMKLLTHIVVCLLNNDSSYQQDVGLVYLHVGVQPPYYLRFLGLDRIHKYSL